MSGAPTLEPGTVFARDFRVERPLAEGGMGAVYVVTQLSTGRRRALKLMQPEIAQNEDLRRRFVLEAKIGASIPSEHVVEVALAGIDEGSGAPYLVMELLEGEDLATRLERGPLSLTDTRELFRQMCHALGCAHEAGVVHRDLKPANVFLAAPRRAGAARFHVKVLDFGIAKMTHDRAASAAKTGMIGTPLWMAPEQTERAPVTAAADVWALGLILYTCVTGRSFWRTGDDASGASMQQIFREMLVDPLPPPGARAREQGVDLPAALEPLLARSVVRDAPHRLPDARAFLAALEDALDGKGALAPPPSERAGGVAARGKGAGGLELDVPDVVGQAASLELAAAPRHAAPSDPLGATIAATPPGHAAVVSHALPMTGVAGHAIPSPSPTRTPALLHSGRSVVPWWAFFVVPIAAAAMFVFVVWSRMHDAQPMVLCRLCTVEDRTHTDGVLRISEVRHDVEARFAELDSRCIAGASGPGRAKLRWKIEDGYASGGRVEGGGQTGVCLLEALAHGAARLPTENGQVGVGRTDVTYVLEWNPEVKP